MLKPAEARELGIFDTIFEPADFLERSLAWAASVVTGEITVERPEVDRSEMWDAVIGFARKTLDDRLHGAPLAPYRALELLRLAKDADRSPTGTAAEDEALADLVTVRPVARRALRVRPGPAPGQEAGRRTVAVAGARRHQGRHRRCRPDGRPDRAAVRAPPGGAGRADRPRPGARRQGRRLRPRRDRQAGGQEADRSEGTAAKLRGLVTGDTDKAAFADADLVLEAVFEDLAVKKQVWAEVEKVVTRRVRPRHEHVVAVGDRDGGRPGAPGARRRHPLLQPGRGDAAGRGRPGREDRRRGAGHRVRGRQEAAQVVRARQGRAVVRGEPAADPVPRRDLRGRRRRARRSTSRTPRSTRSACRCGR